MGPITKLVLVAFACVCILLGVLAVRGCYNILVRPSATPTPAVVTIPTEVEEWADPIAALASLTDFQKLSTLSTRAINPRVKKILYWLYVAERRGVAPEHAIDRAFASNQNSAKPSAAGAKAQTLANFRTAKLWGLFSAEALPRLKRGEAVQIAGGTYGGQFIEIDHIVPVARYPQFANELANLQLLPQSQNRAKGERMGAVEFAKLEELQRLR